jgi:thiamine pyrophosphokinase
VSNRVLGVLAGDGTDPSFLDSWARSADLVLAADGGADLLLACGVTPSIAIGDLDSISLSARDRLPDLRLDPDQNTSDCDKLLALCSKLGHERVTLVAAEGGRVDHMLATLQSAARSGLSVRVGFRQQIAYVLAGPASLSVPDLQPGSLVSLLPLTFCKGVDFEGVRWPVRQADLDPRGLTSLSNVSVEGVRVSLVQGAAILFQAYDGKPHWPPHPRTRPPA